MLERLFVFLLIFVILALGILVFRAWRGSRINRAQPRLESFRLPASDQPTILYFSGEWCSQCRTLQAPALAKLQEELDGQVRVMELDALSRLDLVDSLAVLTLPTTVLLDANGRVRRINDGFADAEKLKVQLAEIDNR